MKALLAAVFAALVLAPAALASHPAGLYTTTDQVATMDDGVGIATTLYTPVTHGGTSPAVMLFHGLGGNRQSLDPIAKLFAQRGYIALTFDFRGHGESGGLFSGLGARELLDVARLREAWLPANAPLDGDKVGGWGISLGGGAALRAAGEGTPFKALEVVETWTDLYEALVPQDLPKSGAIFQFLGAVPSSRQAPELLALQGAVARRDIPALRTFALARSSRQLLSRGYPPTLFFQGRQDFAFGLEQGIAGWQRHSGPKALYIGPFGHAPSKFPGPDFELVMQRALQWFDVHVSGAPDIPNRPAVELADESGKTVRAYPALPPTVRHVYALRGSATIGSAGKVVRRARTLRGARDLRRAHGSGQRFVDERLVAPRRRPRRPHAERPRDRRQRGWRSDEPDRPTPTLDDPPDLSGDANPGGVTPRAHPRGDLDGAEPAPTSSTWCPWPQRARITVRNVTLTIPTLRTVLSR